MPGRIAALAAVLAHVEGFTREEAEVLVLVALASGAKGVLIG